MLFRPAHVLRLGIPAALVAATLITVTGSSGQAAQPAPYRVKFTPDVSSKPTFEPNSVVVKFKKKATTSARKAALSKVKGKADTSVASADVVTVSGETSAPDLLKKVKADSAVELASLNYIRKATATPNDEFYGTDQRYLTTVRVNQAWDLSRTTGSQTIAVLDTGVDAGHPDLAGKLLPGYNTFNTALPPADGDGHGTMVTGIIAASANNGIGVAGVGWAAKVRPVKVLDDTGSGTDATVINGINWAVKNGVRVINMSLGGEGDNPVLHDAVANAVAKGVVVVVAAGNDGSPVLQYPAAYPEVLAVGATNDGGALTSFSSFGNWVDIAAPGWNITSTGPRALTPPTYLPYWSGSGTSFSAPIVAGVAALVRNKWPTLTPSQVMGRLKATARDAGPRGVDPYYGAGILDAYYALGGKWTTDFAGGAADGNDLPARATPITTSVTGNIGTEGETDWYSVTSAAERTVKVKVSGALFDSGEYAQNFGPVVTVFHSDLQAIGYQQVALPPVDSDGYEIPTALVAEADVALRAGTSYIAVRNFNGSRDSRPYTLGVSDTTTTGIPAGISGTVRDAAPADLSSGAAVTTKPTVTFARDVNADQVNGTTVRLLNGKTGASVPSTVSYDAATFKATITPTAPLLDNTPYRILVDSVSDSLYGPFTFTSVFSTVDLTPQPVGTFDATGAYLAANLSWKVPATTDLDQVIVRRNVGSKAPTTTTGTLVFAGTGSSVKNTGLLQGTTYTYAAWVKDRSGKVSPVATTQLLGMKSAISTNATLTNYGGAITLRGSVLRIDNKAYAGLPVAVYVRPKNVSTFKLLTTLKTGTTGSVSYAYKPAVSSVFAMAFLGNGDLMGTRTANITVEVKPIVSATLAPTAIRLGATTRLSGTVNPAHSGRLVYLQQYGNKVWTTIASVKQTSTGYYAFGIKPKARGLVAYRVVFTADADHAQSISANKTLSVS